MKTEIEELLDAANARADAAERMHELAEADIGRMRMRLAEARALLGEWTSGDETAPGLLRRTTAWLKANPGP